MDRTRTPMRLARWSAVAAVAALIIACSSGGGDDPAPAEETTAAEEATAAEESAEAAEAEVPDLVGKNAAIAYDELRALGFTNITLGSVDKEDTVVLMMSNWSVVEVEPEPGTVLSTDSTVVLMCTKQ
ncbi:PASTA domain-containing protein [Glycomyces sp. NRRL B-16210]|uniref:PASTA domain-containing protein n=1 Tax=Glycomyces sp. NRRL B-16210 TaxID=1463821 RepID=UPI0004C0D2D6|nr:PASTA domain-containing protein [Glycomyces sp. NRRL B-16210]